MGVLNMKSTALRGILVLAPLIPLTACLAPQQGSSVDERIRNVENGLVKYTFDESFTMDQIVDFRRIDALPRFAVLENMQSYKVPGVSVAVIDDFEIAWAKAYGVTEAGTNRAVTTETMFQSGSTTKLLMAIVILRMAEEGKLDLDADINTYLKTWKVPEHPSGKTVTLRLLLTHRAGINRPGDGFDTEPGSSPTLLQFLKGEKPVLSDAVSFDDPPGTRHSYSNFGYLIMQYMLEDRFQTSFAQLVEHYVFRPLKLDSSFIEYPFPPQYAARVIRPHDREGTPSAEDGLYSSALAQAGMIATPSDWARIACELMLAAAGRSDKMLSQESVRAMFRTEAELNPAEFEGISGQGLGVFLFSKGQQRYFLHHGHNSPGANCVLIGSQTTGQGAVIMTNGMRGIPLSYQIVSSISKEYGWDKDHEGMTTTAASRQHESTSARRTSAGA
jgi:CubicO group peptidase (beta-lactamase class C family)